jgi:hypothetical protein
MDKYMYIVNYKFSVEPGWDWTPIIERHLKLCKEHGVNSLGAGTPLGYFGNMVEVFSTDLEPTKFMEFMGKTMNWEGNTVGQTSTTVVLRNR